MVLTRFCSGAGGGADMKRAPANVDPFRDNLFMPTENRHRGFPMKLLLPRNPWQAVQAWSL
jgi:hypothetical protein